MEEKLLFEITEHRMTFDGPESQVWLPSGAAEPTRQMTELHLGIYALPDGFSLMSTSSNPLFRGGDTWHPTLEEALAQAESEYGIPAGRWHRVAA